MNIDKILQQNFGLTGKAESFTRKPKKLKKFNSERMMSAYAYLINDKYKQIAEAALLRADVMTMKARGEDDKSIFKKVANAGKDLWRLIKKLVTKLMIFIQEAALKITSKAKKAEKLLAKVEDYRDEINHAVKTGKTKYAGGKYSIKVLDNEEFQKTYDKFKDIASIPEVKKTAQGFNKLTRASRSKSADAAKEFDMIIKTIIRNPEGEATKLKESLEKAKSNVEDYDKVWKEYTGSSHKKPEMLTVESENMMEIGGYLGNLVPAMKQVILVANGTAEMFIASKRTLNLVKNAPTSVTDQFTPELMQTLRELMAKKTEEANLQRKICAFILNEFIVQVSESLKGIKDVVLNMGEDSKSDKKAEDKKEEIKEDSTEK